MDRLRELTRDSGHPETKDSRKLILVLGLMRTKDTSGVIGTSKLCRLEEEPPPIRAGPIGRQAQDQEKTVGRWDGG